MLQQTFEGSLVFDFITECTIVDDADQGCLLQMEDEVIPFAYLKLMVTCTIFDFMWNVNLIAPNYLKVCDSLLVI